MSGLSKPLVDEHRSAASVQQSIYGTPVATASRAAPTSTSLVVGTWDQLSEAFGLQSKIEVQVAKEDRRLQEGLRGIINDRGNQMAIQSAAAQSAELSGMDYETLVQGFLTDGEAIDESSAMSAAWLDYQKIVVVLKDAETGLDKTTLKSIPAGKALVTNKRLIVLSCELSKSAAFTTTGTPKIGSLSGTHKLTYSTVNASQYYPVPLPNFRAVEMDIKSETDTELSVQKKCLSTQPCHKLPCFVGPCCTLCCSACLWLGCDERCGNHYVASPTIVTTSNTRWIRLEFESPGWGERRQMRIQLKPETPLVHIQAWIAMLQSRCPKIVSPPQAQLGEMMVR